MANLDYNKMEMRHKFLQFVKLTGMTDFSVLGVGSTDISMEYSADSETYKWVTQKGGKTISKGYEVTSGVEQFVHADDPLFEAIDKLRRRLATSDAVGELINVFSYETEDDFPTTAPAEKWDISIEFTTFGGSSEDPLTIGYTINYNGTPEVGVATVDYDTATATFAEEVGE